MSDNINTLVPPLTTPELDISFTPTYGIFTYLAGTTAYPTSGPTYYYAQVGVPITFTGTFNGFGLGQPLEWRWDFGDEEIAFGPTATHTYKAPNLTGQVVLRVIDDLNRKTYARLSMYLKN